jgi:hypothetical protein
VKKEREKDRTFQIANQSLEKFVLLLTIISSTLSAPPSLIAPRSDVRVLPICVSATCPSHASNGSGSRCPAMLVCAVRSAADQRWRGLRLANKHSKRERTSQNLISRTENKLKQQSIASRCKHAT